MKILMVGPTLPDASSIVGNDIVIAPPAQQGDIFRAVTSGASAVGLVDGAFETVSPVWHKEILFALSEGVTILGAASMGALRAVECAHYGMVGVGEIYRRYSIGELIDDADVAQLHGPKELGYLALSEPMVNVRATLEAAQFKGDISHSEYKALSVAAEEIFFKARTYKRVVDAAILPRQSNRARLLPMLVSNSINLKRVDAIELVARLSRIESATCPPMEWDFVSTTLWRNSFAT